MNIWGKVRTFRLSLLGAVLLLPALAACQMKLVSLEEAKQITATFEGSTFTPPPRTIKDITAILDEQKLADPGGAVKAWAEATSEPPSGLDGLATASRIVAQIRFADRRWKKKWKKKRIGGR